MWTRSSFCCNFCATRLRRSPAFFRTPSPEHTYVFKLDPSQHEAYEELLKEEKRAQEERLAYSLVLKQHLAKTSGDFALP